MKNMKNKNSINSKNSVNKYEEKVIKTEGSDKNFSFNEGECIEIYEHTNTDGNVNETPSKNQRVKKMSRKEITNIKNNEAYTIIKLIGKGYYSKVYLCLHYNKKYALKVMKKELVLKNKALEMIKNEKNILDKIKISNNNKNNNNNFLINLHSSFQKEKKIYLVFDYYQLDLFSILSHFKKLNETLTKFFLSQVYLAISSLHYMGILYRDLKPENVVIDCENNVGYIKMIDFGLSKQNITCESELKDICGTNEYVPPEAIKQNSYNFSFDWWGFGILMFELLNGSPPFTGESQQEIFDKIIKIDINEIIDSNPNFRNISPAAKDLLSLLLNKDKECRIDCEQIKYHPFFKEINFEKMNKFELESPLKSLLKKLNHLFSDSNSFLYFDNNDSLNKFNNLNINSTQMIEIDQEAFEDF